MGMERPWLPNRLLWTPLAGLTLASPAAAVGPPCPATPAAVGPGQVGVSGLVCMLQWLERRLPPRFSFVSAMLGSPPLVPPVQPHAPVRLPPAPPLDRL